MGNFDVRFMPCFVDHGPTLLHQKQRRAHLPKHLECLAAHMSPSGLKGAMNAYSEDLRKGLVNAYLKGQQERGSRSFGVGLYSVKR